MNDNMLIMKPRWIGKYDIFWLFIQGILVERLPRQNIRQDYCKKTVLPF